MAKCLKKAYFLYLIGGLFGLHHLYLGRDKRAFLWCTTLGGFVLGLMGDLFAMPRYVREANQDEDFLKEQMKKMRQRKTPSFQFIRFVSCIGLGSFFNYVTKYCFHSAEETFFTSTIFPNILSPFIVSYVIYCFGTEGPMKCAFKWVFLGAFLSNFVNIFQEKFAVCNSPFYATLFLNWNLEWDEGFYERVKKKKTFKRALLYWIRVALVFGLFGVFVWHNASLEMDGKKMSIKEWAQNFLDSKEMKIVIESLKALWHFYRAHGFYAFMNMMLYGTDGVQIANAYKVIDVSESTSQQELDAKCKALSRKWHPDKFKDPMKKQEAESMFMEIQAACNLLSEDRKNKIKLNQRPNQEL